MCRRARRIVWGSRRLKHEPYRMHRSCRPARCQSENRKLQVCRSMLYSLVMAIWPAKIAEKMGNHKIMQGNGTVAQVEVSADRQETHTHSLGACYHCCTQPRGGSRELHKQAESLTLPWSTFFLDKQAQGRPGKWSTEHPSRDDDPSSVTVSSFH